MGAAPEDINALTSAGPAAFDTWLTVQRAQPVSLIRPHLDAIRVDIAVNNTDATVAPYHRPLLNDFTLATNVVTAWMRNVVHGKDQLRQRVAWALSQIMVVSYNNVSQLRIHGAAIAGYYDVLARNALGNFRDLLRAVSLNPAMCFFLSSLGNEKADPANNQYPDENYAREVMQLFTIGLWELNPDGTQKRDAAGNPIPTYDNRDVEEMARVFTGVWFEGRPWPGPNGNFPGPWLMDYPIGLYEDRHDQLPKTLFHDKPWQVTLPRNNGARKDIEAAIDALVNHPNTAPFIATALIRFLVTSNPSPAYVKRVADVFVNNGQGVRGDLFATVRAILLDTDARNATARANPRAGKLQEPMLRVTRMVRAFGAGRNTTDFQFWSQVIGPNLQQWPLAAPSVFNFFMPGYRHLGTLARNGLNSPEFQILNSVSIATLSNQFAQFVDGLLHPRMVPGQPEFRFDFTTERGLAATPDALLDRLNLLLCGNTMSGATRTQIRNAVNAIPVTNIEGRVRLAVWLTAVSAEAATLQ
jgi:uncharacterized protein (DUF1800 family)